MFINNKSDILLTITNYLSLSFFSLIKINAKFTSIYILSTVEMTFKGLMENFCLGYFLKLYNNSNIEILEI